MQGLAIKIVASWVALSSVLWVADPVTGGEIYKWVDGSGKVHFSDRPLPGAQSMHLRDVPQPLPPRDREVKRERLLQVFEEQRREKREKMETKNKLKQDREHNCNLAKDRLQGYEQAGYIYKIDKKGNRVIFDEEQQATAIQAARDAVKQWCKKA